MTFDVLPTLGVIGNKTFTEGTPFVLDSALTIADTDGDHLMKATVKTFGGFAGDDNTLTFSAAGTSIVGNLVSVNGNLTLTLSGYDTVAHQH
jgi:hypothetical protein